MKPLAILLLSTQVLTGAVVFSAAGRTAVSPAAQLANAVVYRVSIPMDGLHGKCPNTAATSHSWRPYLSLRVSFGPRSCSAWEEVRCGVRRDAQAECRPPPYDEGMSAPSTESPDQHDVIHPGKEAAVVVPMDEYRRLRALSAALRPRTWKPRKPMPCVRPTGSGWPLAGRVRSHTRKQWPSCSPTG